MSKDERHTRVLTDEIATHEAFADQMGRLAEFVGDNDDLAAADALRSIMRHHRIRAMQRRGELADQHAPPTNSAVSR